jgi:hypothetical protein
MRTHCPLCDTRLDPASGECPACHWQAANLIVTRTPASVPPVSLTERYRGTEWDSTLGQEDLLRPHVEGGFPRARIMLVVGIVAAATVYGTIVVAMGGGI